MIQDIYKEYHQKIAAHNETCKIMNQEECIKNMHHPNVIIRIDVARKIDASHLPEMMNDEDSKVRWQVASRIDVSYLPQMMYDTHKNVRRNVSTRIVGEDYMKKMMNDEDWMVRWNIAHRINKIDALLISGIDKEEIVRKAALENVLGIKK
jgi:HEAT repeat protein